MAVYLEVQVGRYVRFLQKFLGIKGRQPAPLTFSGELGAHWCLFHGVENRYLEGWERFMVSLNIAAGGVGFNSVVRLRNPATSGVIAVLEKVTWTNSVAVNANLQKDTAGTADFGTLIALTSSNIDSRTRPQPVLIGSSQNTAAFSSGNTLFSGNAPANGTVDLIWDESQEITLLPNNSYVFREAQLNQSMIISLMWRERILEESERT